jgi:catecholate siderophore receptor
LLCVSSALGLGKAFAEPPDPPADDGTNPGQADKETIVVTGVKEDRSGINTQNLPQVVSTVSAQLMRQQATTRLEDALRNVPGITLNIGEGGAHGDTVNLRGFPVTDGFFLDGVRDLGSYARDSFDIESLEVLKGPSAILFGQGSAGGVIDQVSKAPRLAPLIGGALEFGSNQEFRGMADINHPLSDSAAFRIAIMGEQSEVTDRDNVKLKRWGFAPSLAFGIGEPTTLSFSYFHQTENNIPDYGIPFLFDAPAPVPRNLYYGLKNDDVTQTNVNILTVKLKHEINDVLTVTDTFRYANYWSNYRVTTPTCGDNNADGDGEPPPPSPGMPLSDILVLRDRPSSSGTQTDLINRVDVTGKFTTGEFAHRLLTGIEVGRETDDLVRYSNQADEIPPVPLLAPNPNQAIPGTQQAVDSRPSTTADTLAIYAVDTMELADHWSAMGGVRYDRFAASFNEPLSGSHFERTDTAWTPHAALLFKPDETQTYYISYGKSFDPTAAYLTLAPDSASPAPERAETYEAGAKISWLGGQLFTTAAIFRTELKNARISDPDDPSLQEIAGQSQRVQGLEFGINGYLTESWEVTAGFAYLDSKIVSSVTPGETGSELPNTPETSGSVWVTYETDGPWRFGGGLNYVGHRFADTMQSVDIPGYVIFGIMAGYKVTDDIDLQFNIKNLTDKYYYDASYYTSPLENHVIPGPGRTFTLATSFRF